MRPSNFALSPPVMPMATPVMVPKVPMMPVPSCAPRPGVVAVNARLVGVLDVHRLRRGFIVVMMLNDPAFNDLRLFDHRRPPFPIYRAVEVGRHGSR